MKVLIAVLSCYSLQYCEQSVRDTWVSEIPTGVDYKFFLGRRQGIHDASYRYAGDEIYLDVDDSFHGVTEKTVAIYNWALSLGYDYVFKCDLDTLIRPMLLLRSSFAEHDYVGGYNEGFASGGSGYWISKRAMEYVVQGTYEPGPAEDWNIANILRDNGIKVHGDDRYVFRPGYKMDDHTITYHLSSIRQWGKVPYDPKWMYETWQDQNNRHYRTYSLAPEPKAIAPTQIEGKAPRPLRAPPRGLR